MIGREPPRDPVGISGFIEAGDVEADGAGLHRMARGFGHQRDDAAAVDPAREERAERHVGDHARSHRLAHQRDQFLLQRLRRRPAALGEADVPITLRLGQRPATYQPQRLARAQLAHARDEAGVVGDVAIGHIILDRRKVGRAAQQRMGEQALQFRSEDQAAVRQQRIMKRLHPKPVPRQPERAGARIEQREGEHAVEAMDALLAPLAIAMKNDFGVAMGAKDMALRLQFGAHFREIVDFAVEDDRQALILGQHRLRAAGQVDDRQAQMAQAHARRGPNAAAVGTAMRHRVQHRAHPRGIDGLCRFEVEDARYAAHGRRL